MKTAVHESAVKLLQLYFEVPNEGIIINFPIEVLGFIGKKNFFRLLTYYQLYNFLISYNNPLLFK